MGGGRGGGGMEEETIYVAVGKKLDRNTATLSWALRNFRGKRICLLHVHKPNYSAALDGSLSTLKNGFTVLQKDNEMEKVHLVLNECLEFLAQEGVEAGKACIEMDDVGKGIVEGILCYNIRWLVMGGAASKHYSKKLSGLKSRKAIFVCQNAPDFSHIWFTCKGCLIYTRDVMNDELGIETALPLLPLNSGSETELVEFSGKELPSIAYYKQKSLDFVRNSSHVFEQRSRSGDFSSGLRNGNESEEILRCLALESSEKLAITWKTTSESDEDDGYGEAAVHDIYCKLEEVRLNGKNYRREQFNEAVKRWKAEDDVTDVKNKAMELETSFAKAVKERKDLEQALSSKRQDVETMKNQRHEMLAELDNVQKQKSVLANRISESRLAVAELEEKILSAVKLLISFKAQRDELRVEHGNALKEVSRLRRSAKLDDAPSLSRPQIHLFSFEEIIEATNSFDPSLRIGESKHGTVYRGTLRHVQVAIKMLPSFGSRRDSDFEHEVELSIRVRHLNLVTLIGTCPESRALIYEYLKNGSLEDRLSCKSKTRPLSWQARTIVACDVFSALIFLHSHDPPIVHGNLKPSNILLDANLVAKISDLGIFHNLYPPETTLDVYSFGIMLLRLISGRTGPEIVKDLKCALEKGNFESILDDSAGEWPLDQAVQLFQLALRCTEGDGLDLVSDVWAVLEPMRTVSIEFASNERFKEGCSAPSHFVCPILQEVMKEPHIAADGFTYEAEAIQGWLKSHNTSPMTNLKLETTDLVPNHALFNAIQGWRRII